MISSNILAVILALEFADKSYFVVDTACVIIITVILAFSIYRIRKYSKSLTKNKIYANQYLMVTHLLSFLFLAIILVVYGILDFKTLTEQEK